MSDGAVVRPLLSARAVKPPTYRLNPLLAGGIAAILVLTIAAILSMLALRQHELDEQRESLGVIATLVAHHADGLIYGTRRAGKEVEQQLLTGRDDNGATTVASSPEMRSVLQRIVAVRPFIGGITIVGSRGRVLSHAGVPVDAAAATPVVYRARTRSGLTILCTMSAAALDELYADVDRTGQHRVALADGAGVHLGRGATDRLTRMPGSALTARAALRTEPWTVTISYPREAALAGWSKGSIGAAIAILLLDAAILLLARLGGRQIDSSEAMAASANRLARSDILTGLPNRLRFQEEVAARIAHARLHDETVAILAIDLDGFKTVNDRFGHACGDVLLRLVARRILGRLPKGDLLARICGDEFAVIQSVVFAREATAILAAQLAAAFAEPFALPGGDVRISASFGVALALRDGSEADELLGKADLALYASKQERLGQLVFYEPAMSDAAARYAGLKSDLAEAVARDQFVVHFQPVFDVESDRAVGCEALLRWQHPIRGLVAPDEFIPILETTGWIVQVGEWVLRRACLEAAFWPETMRVAVNLSALQCRAPGIVGTVRAVLFETGLTPGRLELEITESVSLDQGGDAVAILHELRALGVRIALDDFGTGYASLSYLTRFPFDRIKIDRSFVATIGEGRECGVIVRGAIEMARRLGMGVTAEGVETPEQLALLRSKRCSEVQGYLLSQPLDTQALRAFLATRDDDGAIVPPRPSATEPADDRRLSQAERQACLDQGQTSTAGYSRTAVHLRRRR